MRRRPAAPLLAVLLLGLPDPTAAAFGARCGRALLVGAGRRAATAIRCEAMRARSGVNDGRACGLEVFAHRGVADRRGHARCGGAAVIGSARTVVTNLLAHLGSLLRPGDVRSRCAADKLRAAARRIRSGTACTVRAGGGAAPCLARARLRLARAFARAESHSTCPSTGDAGTVDDRIDRFTNATATLAPGGRTVPGFIPDRARRAAAGGAAGHPPPPAP
jgi:hypothetical protein